MCVWYKAPPSECMNAPSTDKVQGQDVWVAPDELLRLHKGLLCPVSLTQATLSANAKLVIPRSIDPSFSADKNTTLLMAKKGSEYLDEHKYSALHHTLL